jgi:hypothetical protein
VQGYSKSNKDKCYPLKKDASCVKNYSNWRRIKSKCRSGTSIRKKELSQNGIARADNPLHLHAQEDQTGDHRGGKMADPLTHHAKQARIFIQK